MDPQPIVRTLVITFAGARATELVAALRASRDVLLLDVVPDPPAPGTLVGTSAADLIIVQMGSASPPVRSVLEQISHVAPALVLAGPDRALAALAFDVDAVDFWTAGCERVCLPRTLARVRARQHAAREARLGRRLLDAVRRRDAQIGRRRIALRSEGMMVMVDPDTIHRLEAVGNYVRVVHAGGATIVRCTLDSLSEKLGDGFIRVHRSHVVCAERVRALKTSRNRREVLMADGTIVPLGRRFAALVEQRLSDGRGTANPQLLASMASMVGSLDRHAGQ